MPSSAATPAHWMALNWPESTLPFTAARAEIISALPATQPSRQPVMLNVLDSECSSTATSLAPAAWKMLGGGVS